MSLYPPPNEILPIFNPINYDLPGNTDPNDISFLTGYFTRYPVSQGSQTISGTLVSTGQVTAQTNIVMSGTPATNYIEFPDGTKQYTAGGGGAGTLSSVLTAGNTATNSITLDNLGAGNNEIRILPNFSPNNTHIELSDGTVPNTNKITKNGYTTHNSNENQPRYLTFSRSSADSTEEIRKSDKFVVNPFLGTFSATGRVTATGGLTTGTGSVLTSTGTTTLTGATTATGLITANGGLITGAGRFGDLVLTSTGTTTLTGATTATGLITANGGLTTGTLTSTGTTTLGGATTVNGLINALGGLTTSTLTSAGTTTLSGATTATATALITANGGLTMGGSNNITLGSGITPPTAGQLGGLLINSPTPGTVIDTLYPTGKTITTAPQLTVGPGVWWIIVAVCFQSATGTTAESTPFAQLSIDRNNTGVFAIETLNFSTVIQPSPVNFSITSIIGTALTTTGSPSLSPGTVISGTGITAGTYIVSGSGNSWVVSVSQTVGAITGTYYSNNKSNVNFANAFHFTGAVNVIRLQAGKVTSGSANYLVASTAKFSYLKVVKIA
jgi:hypothetical protein